MRLRKRAALVWVFVFSKVVCVYAAVCGWEGSREGLPALSFTSQGHRQSHERHTHCRKLPRLMGSWRVRGVEKGQSQRIVGGREKWCDKKGGRK